MINHADKEAHMNDTFDLISLLDHHQELQHARERNNLLACNQMTARFGLTLTPANALELLARRNMALHETRRVEFGDEILPQLIAAFCDSAYMEQAYYAQTLSQLLEMFYSFKNDSMEQLTDGELIGFMRKQFDTVCFGDLCYLRETCLERFTRAVRAGYRCQEQHRPRNDYALQETENEYLQFDEETRWDPELYQLQLEDLI